MTAGKSSAVAGKAHIWLPTSCLNRKSYVGSSIADALTNTS
jgi:hypothetical protein